MSVLHHSSANEIQCHRPFALRLLRGIGSVFLFNPFPIIVAALCVWLLWTLGAGFRSCWSSESTPSVSDTLGCAACFGLLTMLTLMASGHILITFFAGWNEDKS